MKKIFTTKEVADEFYWYVRRNFRTHKEAAEKYQCSTSFISSVTRGNKLPNKEMLKDIGFEKITVYART